MNNPSLESRDNSIEQGPSDHNAQLKAASEKILADLASSKNETATGRTPDTVFERAAVIGKAAATAFPEGVGHALLGMDHLTVPFSENLAGRQVSIPVPSIVENAAVGTALGFAAKTLLPQAGVLGKIGSVALAGVFLSPLVDTGNKVLNDLRFANSTNELETAGKELGSTAGILAGSLPVGIASYKYGAQLSGSLMATEAMGPFVKAKGQFYDGLNQKIALGLDAGADALKGAFAIKPEYSGSHAVAEKYDRIPQSLIEKLKGDDYKLPTVKLEPGSGDGVRVLVVTGHGVEAPEFTEVYNALKTSGADVKVATPDWMWDYQQPKGSFSLAQWMENQHIAQSDMKISEGIDLLKKGQLDAVYVPGGAGNTAALRTDGGAQAIIKEAHDLGKEVWTICHGGQVLISAEAFPKGTVLTGSPDIRPQDLPNAGFVVPKEQQVVWDGSQKLLSGQDPNALNPYLEALGKRLQAIKAEHSGVKPPENLMQQFYPPSSR